MQIALLFLFPHRLSCPRARAREMPIGLHSAAKQTPTRSPFGDALGLQFGDQACHSLHLGPWPHEAGQLLQRWRLTVDGDVPVRLTLCCDAHQAHPKALRCE